MLVPDQGMSVPDILKLRSWILNITDWRFAKLGHIPNRTFRHFLFIHCHTSNCLRQQNMKSPISKESERCTPTTLLAFSTLWNQNVCRSQSQSAFLIVQLHPPGSLQFRYLRPSRACTLAKKKAGQSNS